MYKEISALWQVYSVNPIFGVDYEEEEKMPAVEQAKVLREEDDVEIIEGSSSSVYDAQAAYFADPNKQHDRDVVFDDDLGLAVEAT